MNKLELRRNRKQMKTYLAAATSYMVPICVSCGRVTRRAVDEGNGEVSQASLAWR